MGISKAFSVKEYDVPVVEDDVDQIELRVQVHVDRPAKKKTR